MRLGDMEPILRSYIIKAIRTAFVRSQVYQEVKRQARVEEPRFKKDGTLSKKKSVSYRCASCSKTFKANEINVDHISTIVDKISSSMDMTVSQYVRRVFCSASNLQVLCSNGKDSCHSKKTREENKSRVKRDRKGNVLSSKKTRKKSKKHLL